LRPEVPTLADLPPQLVELLRGRVLVIYNADYYTGILTEPLRLGPPAVYCWMLAFAEYYGDWNEWFGSFSYQNLAKAARHVLHRWTHPVHTALGDCLATLSVWQSLQSPEWRL
jgi:DNA polymerase-3 subunit epsilon